MKKRSHSLRIAAGICGAFAFGLVLFVVPQARALVQPSHRQSLPDVDKRASITKADRVAERSRGQEHLKNKLPEANVDFDPLLDSPAFVRSSRGFLTGANGEGGAVSALAARGLPQTDPHRAIKAFLNEHSALFGHGADPLQNAKISRDSVTKHNGLRTVVWQQELDGIPVFESTLIGNISKKGELVSLASRFLPEPALKADAGVKNRKAVQARPPIAVERATANAAENLGDSLATSVVVDAPNPAGFRVIHPDTGIPAYARLVWLPMNRETMRLAWEIMISQQSSRERFQFLIDAESGEVLVRRLLTRYISDATYNVYTSDSPSPFSPGNQTPSTFQPPLTNRVLVTTPALDANASPNGWINDGDNTTKGNNADTFVDRNFDFQPDGPRPQGVPSRVFDFPLDLTQDPLVYSNASTVQLFYWINWYHDRLYELGFTEAAGNYQLDNFGRGGLGGIL